MRQSRIRAFRCRATFSRAAEIRQGMRCGTTPRASASPDGIAKELARPVEASALVDGKRETGGPLREITSPHDRRVKVGVVREADEAAIAAAMASAAAQQQDWDGQGGEARAAILEKAADLYEANTHAADGAAGAGGGQDARQCACPICARRSISCATMRRSARAEFSGAACVLPGPTGERNELTLHGRGVFACISPWNFPLAIFTGQVAAALASGNAVIAKPAEQTPLVAHEAVKLLHQAGVPPQVLHFLPGDGARIGKTLLAHPALSGVAFTGSNETARIINRALAARDGAIPALIAETGGMNAMIVDSSALARAGGARRACLRLRQRRPALFGGAPPVRAGGYRAARHSDAERRHGGAHASAIRWTMPPISARSSTRSAKKRSTRTRRAWRKEAKTILDLQAAARSARTAPSCRPPPMSCRRSPPSSARSSVPSCMWCALPATGWPRSVRRSMPRASA